MSMKRMGSTASEIDPDHEMAPILDNVSGSLSVKHHFSEAACGSLGSSGHHYDDTWWTYFMSWPFAYQELLDLSWSKLILGAFLLFTGSIMFFGVSHWAICLNCGAKSCNFVGSFYYAIVSIVANGGYEGEDAQLVTYGTTCFGGRTVLTWLAAFVGMSIIAMLTTILVGRMSRHTSLSKRIHFSHNAVVHRLPPGTPSAGDAAAAGAAGPLVLQCRIATSHHRPLFNVEVSAFAIVIAHPHHPHRRAADATPIARDEDVAVYTTDLAFTYPEGLVPQRHADDGKRYAQQAELVKTQQLFSQRMNLWYPVTITHWLEHPDSPLRSYVTAPGSGPQHPALAHHVQIVIQVVATDPLNGANVVARKVYSQQDLATGFRFDDRGLVQLKTTRAAASTSSRHIHVNVSRLNSLVAEGSQ